MQAGEVSEPATADIVTMIALRMRQMGVPGFPRNYELFYQAATTADRHLAEELLAVGPRPKQEQLDQLFRKFVREEGQAAVENAHSIITSKLDEILRLLKKERSSMETYGRILDETSTGLGKRNAMSKEFLEKIVEVMATATRSSIENRDHFATSMAEKSSELREVKSKLEEYKRLAETDALTQLYNRGAFDRRIAKIYDSNRDVAFGALVLIDIDRFKLVNDQFGHPVGDRIIRSVASIIRSVPTEGAFVARTGGEEFAVVLEGCGEETTFSLADKIRVAIQEAPFVNVATGAKYGPVTVSAGTCMATQAQGPEDLYAKADRALYASKAAGRNRVTRFSSLSLGMFTKNWMIYRKD